MILADITVSAFGLIVGLILLAVCVWLGNYFAASTGQPWLRLLGVVVGIVVFLVLGFDVTDESQTIR